MSIEQTYEHNGKVYLTDAYYQFLLKNDLIVDGSAGGLVIGPSHKEGGIQMIQINRDARIFLAQKIEGWQLTINAFAEFDNQAEIKQLCPNSHIGDSFFLPYTIPDGVDVINITPREVNGSMITPYYYFGTNIMGVVKKEAAKRHIHRFTEMNRAAWQKHVIDANPTPTIREEAVLARLIPRNNN